MRARAVPSKIYTGALTPTRAYRSAVEVRLLTRIVHETAAAPMVGAAELSA